MMNTEHYSLTISSDGDITKLEIWFDSEDEILRVKDGDEITEGTWATITALGIMWHLLPFMAYSSGFELMFTEPDGFKVFEVVDKKSDKRNFGTGYVRVERYDVRYTWAAADMVFSYEVTKVGQKYMFTYWRFKITDDYMEMIVHKAIPR